MVDRGDFDRSSYESDSGSGTTYVAENAASEMTAQAPAANANDNNDNGQGQNQAPAPSATGNVEVQSSGSPSSNFTVEKVESYDKTRVTLELQAGKGKELVLPADTQIEAILVSGNDLILREADGT